MQDFNILDQARIDEIARGVRKTACIELVGERHTINENGDPVSPDTADVDAFSAEARTGAFVIDARHITKRVTDRGSEFGVQLASRQDRNGCSYVSNRALVLVRDHDNLVDRFIDRTIARQRNDGHSKESKRGSSSGRDGGIIHLASTWIGVTGSLNCPPLAASIHDLDQARTPAPRFTVHSGKKIPASSKYFEAIAGCRSHCANATNGAAISSVMATTLKPCVI